MTRIATGSGTPPLGGFGCVSGDDLGGSLGDRPGQSAQPLPAILGIGEASEVRAQGQTDPDGLRFEPVAETVADP
jgi:hypothetical protein